MTFLNEGQQDRGVRTLVGIVLVATGWALSLNTFGVVLFVFGAIALSTGIIGWCPAYSLFGFSTVKTPVGHCPNCDNEHHHF
jgi:hypothetical protein